MSMIDHAPTGYTAYAKSLCPSWCSEPHAEMTDERDFPAVLHECTVGTVAILDISVWTPEPKTVGVRVQRYDNLSPDRPADGSTVHIFGNVTEVALRPEDAAKVALLVLKATEVARTP